MFSHRRLIENTNQKTCRNGLNNLYEHTHRDNVAIRGGEQEKKQLDMLKLIARRTQNTIRNSNASLKRNGLKQPFRKERRFFSHFGLKQPFRKERRCLSHLTLPLNNNKDDNNGKPEPAKKDDKPMLSSYIPGLGVSAAVMTASFFVADHAGKLLLAAQGLQVEKSPISGIPVAIILGLALNNTIKLPDNIRPGTSFATTTVLRAGIVCVGAKLSMIELFSAGLIGIPVVMLCIGTGISFVRWFGNYMGLPPRMSSLIAAGTSICGVTAITAVAPAIKAKPQEVSYAVANVVAFGTLGLMTYPYLAHTIFEHSSHIGMFLGLAIHDTSQVIGSALTYHQVFDDEVVLKTATITKLTRNVFLAGVIPALAYSHASVDEKDTAPKFSLQLLQKYLPSFVLGFVGMSCVRSIGDYSLLSFGNAYGIFDEAQWSSTVKFVGNELGGHYLLGTAMAAVGLNTSMSVLKEGNLGIKPFIVGSAGCVVVGATAFTTLAGLYTYAGWI